MFEKIVCLPSGFGNATDRHIVATKFFDAFFPTHVKPMLMSIIIAIITVTLIMAVLQSNLYLAQWISPVLVYSMLSSIRKRDTEMAQYHHPMHALVVTLQKCIPMLAWSPGPGVWLCTKRF